MGRKCRREPPSLEKACEVSVAELHQQVRSWPQEKLAELLLSCLGRDTDLLARVQREIVMARSPGAAVSRLKADIDNVLNVKFVEWNRVDAYVTRLEHVLASVVSLGKTSAREALGSALYFVERIPSIFDSVHCEDELGLFCDELVRETLKLAARERPMLRDTIARLLDAYMKDGHGQFNNVPERIAATSMNAEDREWLVGEVMRLRTNESSAGSSCACAVRNILGE